MWDLLTRDFDWLVPERFPIQVYRGDNGRPVGLSRLQLFEVAVAAICAEMQPDFEWFVTENRPDDGLDFLGRAPLLLHESLGISAIVTIGGQCKKRTEVDTIVDVVAGSLVNMGFVYKPSVFLVALSARVSPERVAEAKARLQSELNRNCHILDRAQLEGLIHDHLDVLETILPEALSPHEVEDVLRYFRNLPAGGESHSITAAPRRKAYTGLPFRIPVTVRSPLVASGRARVRWKASSAVGDAGIVRLIWPIGADPDEGATVASDETTGDPTFAQCFFEFEIFAVGMVDLGEVTLEREVAGAFEVVARAPLGHIKVVATLRPRFFDLPFTANLSRLEDAYAEAERSGTAAIGVVGTGGSGKSRLCEEFCLDKQRRGANVVVARQAKTLNDPHRLLAEILVALAPDDLPPLDPAAGVIQAVSRYDPELAQQVAPAIRSVFDSEATAPRQATGHGVIHAILVLLVARRRRMPLILHLQDLHWCNADVLLMLEQLIWQLDTLTKEGVVDRVEDAGVLFIFEGRVREKQRPHYGGWTSELFEAFLEKLGCPTARCSDFSRDEGFQFISRLFEDRYNVQRRVDGRLLELQSGLIERIHQASGGNPFHSLEHLRWLKDNEYIRQNLDTGLLYLIRPEPAETVLPDSIFESVRLRWQYLRTRSPELALLIWGVALLDDRVEAPLFRWLRRELAPDIAEPDIEATDLVWPGDGRTTEAAFRHENYFDSVRRFDVSAEDRRRVVDVYANWFASMRRPGPLDKFRWGRALLKYPVRDVSGAQRLFRSAWQTARRHGDASLARRIAIASLDVAWDELQQRPIRNDVFLRNCDEELALTADLLASDRLQASSRLERLRSLLDQRLSRTSASPRLIEALERRRFAAEVLRSELLFNDRQPAMAAEVAVRAVQGIRRWQSDDRLEERESWDALEMSALHSHAVALALSGEIDQALATSEQAVAIARRSSLLEPLRVVSTHANILLARDPVASEAILRDCLAQVSTAPPSTGNWSDIKLNLAMALILRGHRAGPADEDAEPLLDEAERLLHDVLDVSYRRGEHPDVGAAALLLGIVSALRNHDDEASWFLQAVTSAAHGSQMETLWRAQINLATALYRRDGVVTDGVHERARAALRIMDETLATYPQPDRSPRFRLLAVPLAQAVRFLILAGDDAGVSALERYPALRSCFRDASRGILDEDRGGYRSHEWLRVGTEDYVIY